MFNPLFTHIVIISWYSLSLIYPLYYPPPYERTVWYYNRANADLTQREIDLFDWEALRFNDVDKQVTIFSDTFQNMMQNFISNETVISDDRDPP